MGKILNERRISRKLMNIPQRSANSNNRSLFLDWFDSESKEEKEKGEANVKDSMKKIMEMVQLADSFKQDPHFDVNVEINYQNENMLKRRILEEVKTVIWNK